MKKHANAMDDYRGGLNKDRPCSSASLFSLQK